MARPRSPFIHQTPAEALEQVVTQQIQLVDQCFEITYPSNADALLDHPATHAAFNQDEYMPYWADLWPSAQMLGEALLQAEKNQTVAEFFAEIRAQGQALEIGCGVGLPGIVALSLGLRVIFSDYDRAALDFVHRNARANGFQDEQFEQLPLDWRSPPEDLKVSLLLASDVIYEQRNIQPLIHLIQTVVQPSGQCWLVDPNRPFQSEFETALCNANLRFIKTPVTWEKMGEKTVEGMLFKVCL